MIKAIHHHPINKSLQCKNNNCNKHCFLRVIWTRRTMLLWYDGKRCSIMKSRPSMYYQVPTTSVWVKSFWETNTPTDKWCLKYVGLFQFWKDIPQNYVLGSNITFVVQEVFPFGISLFKVDEYDIVLPGNLLRIYLIERNQRTPIWDSCRCSRKLSMVEGRFPKWF